MTRLLFYIYILSLPFYGNAQPVTQDPPPVVEQANDNAAATPVYTQRTFDEGFKEKYDDDDFDYVEKEKSQSFISLFFEWLDNLLDSIFGDRDATDTEIQWKSIIYKVIFVLILLAVVYFIVAASLNNGNPWIFRKSKNILAPHDIASEDIHEMDFPTLIEQTKNSGNYRLAVRYYYLWLLKKLSVREIIAWNWDKTNSDYLYEINDGTLKKDFEYLSYLYDYSWYGEFSIDNHAFNKAEKAFRKTLNTL